MATQQQEWLEILNDVCSSEPTETTRAQRKRAKGLPDDKARKDLARTWLKLQSRLWPELVKKGIIVKASDSNVSRMADQFREAFLSDRITPFSHERSSRLWECLGVAYVRYSDAGSNPRSLDQQLVNILTKARQLNVFVPWEYVFADAAITGTVASRHGYQLAKSAMSDDKVGAGCLIIDELGRASRDSVEALTLGRLITSCNKRMVGATDSFDSSTPMSSMMLHVFAMLNGFFVDQLREKVKRGMRDAFDQGGNLGKPAIGYKLVPVLDQQGNQVLDDENCAVRERVIDEAAAVAIREAYDSFVNRSMSRDKIARCFNDRSIGGVQTWDSARLKQLLQRSVYRGVEYYEMTYQERDPSTGGVTVRHRLQSEWKVRQMPHLKIVDEELWQAAQDRLAKSKEVYDKSRKEDGPSRTEFNPTTVVRPICGVCKRPLWMGRGGKYASFSCLHGKDGKSGCTFKGYKSVRIVEQAVLREVSRVVLNESFAARVAREANLFFSSRPVESKGSDLKQLEKNIAKKKRAIEAITSKLEDADNGSELKAVFDTVARMQRELDGMQAELSKFRARNAPPPAPVTTETVAELLKDFRGLLQEDIGAVAPILAKLTGDVVVTQEPHGEKDEPVWVARFTLNAVPLMVALTSKKDDPGSGAWEYLNTAAWTIGEEIEVVLENTPKYQEMAKEAAAMRDAGASNETIAHALETTWETVHNALQFADTGDRPEPKPDSKRTTKRGPNKGRVIADEVVRLRDEENLSFSKIAERLSVSIGTATRAYDSKQPEVVVESARSGKSPPRGRRTNLPKETFIEIERLSRKGKSVTEIVAAVGCSRNTVLRERHRLGLD